jgi:hypothetical protein
MQAFQKNKRQSYLVISCRKIADMYAGDGENVLHAFAGPRFEPSSSLWFYQQQLGYCFDDLGTEEKKHRYKNSVEVMEHIIQNRYDNRYRYPFNQTHITTNNGGNELEERYGSRVRSRMREMFNHMVIPGDDRRK